MHIVNEIRQRQHGSRIAVRDGSSAISFDELFAAVDELKIQLLKHDGFASYEIPRIGVLFPNGLAYIVVALAVIDAGACFVPIPDELSKPERDQVINNTALHAVFSFEECGNAESVTLPLHLGKGFLSRTVGHHQPGFPEDEFNTLHPAFIRFSSGTTGESKGVVLSHVSLLERIVAANEALQLAPGDTVLWTLPMAHHFAVSIVLYLYFGATTVIETTHTPDQLFNAARDTKTNLLYGSPFHFAQLAQYAEAHPLPDLRLAICTASALNEHTARAFSERFNLPLTQALGIIEIGLPIVNKKHAGTIPEALGQTLPAYDARIVGEKEGVGELQIRGPGMFDAYLLPWQRREGIVHERWFSTGDLVELLDGETFVLRGRSKSVINVSGMKVFPEEIEAVLNEHPLIEKSHVFAVDHALTGAFPAARIQLVCCAGMPGFMELREFCTERLSPYKVPMRFEEVEKVEQTANGKIKRH